MLGSSGTMDSRRAVVSSTAEQTGTLMCKRVERLNLYDAMAQARNDACPGEVPTVFHRRDRCEWLVTMPLDDWIKMYREAMPSEHS